MDNRLMLDIYHLKSDVWYLMSRCLDSWLLQKTILSNCVTNPNPNPNPNP
ncbi:hypothetical protein [Chryseobacterium sp. OSA05B]|nr:hypothetical protein [Chryseobacterium sp. OSA05B]